LYCVLLNRPYSIDSQVLRQTRSLNFKNQGSSMRCLVKSAAHCLGRCKLSTENWYNNDWREKIDGTCGRTAALGTVQMSRTFGHPEQNEGFRGDEPASCAWAMVWPCYSWEQPVSVTANRWFTLRLYWLPLDQKVRHNTSARQQFPLIFPETAYTTQHTYGAILGLSDDPHCLNVYDQPTSALLCSRQSSNAPIYER
jgi:hypothetical protein